MAHLLFVLRPGGGQSPLSSSELSSTSGSPSGSPGMKKVREPGPSGSEGNDPAQGGGINLFRSVRSAGATRPDVLRPVPMAPGWRGSEGRDGRSVGSSGAQGGVAGVSSRVAPISLIAWRITLQSGGLSFLSLASMCKTRLSMADGMLGTMVLGFGGSSFVMALNTATMSSPRNGDVPVSSW